MKVDWVDLDFEHDSVCDECGAPAQFIRSMPVTRKVKWGFHGSRETTYIRALRCSDHCPVAARKFGWAI